MNSQGPNNPGTMAVNSSSGDISWRNEDDAKTSNDQYAQAQYLGQAYTYYLEATNFNFSIPTGSLIRGVLVEVEGKHDADAATIADNYLLVGGVRDGEDPNSEEISLGTSDAYYELGARNLLWGCTLTPTIVNASDFGVQFNCYMDAGGLSEQNIYIDHIRMTVYFTEVKTINELGTLSVGTVNGLGIDDVRTVNGLR